MILQKNIEQQFVAIKISGFIPDFFIFTSRKKPITAGTKT